jgi:hypothetical protein
MDPRDARVVLQEARRWRARGLLTAEAYTAIEAEYAADAEAGGAEPQGLGIAILYALAGVLVGAACVAVPILLEVADDWIGLWLLALGAPLLALGLLLWVRGAPPGIVDALLVGSLVPLTFMGAPSDTAGRWLAPVGLAAAVALTWLPRASPTLPILASAATFAAAGILSFQWFEEPGFLWPGLDTLGTWTWMLLTLAQLAATVLVGRAKGLPWRLPVSALLCVGAVAPFVLLLEDVVTSEPAHFYELMVGLFELSLLTIGLGLRERGLVLGGALVVAADAIVFAFQVDVLFGILVLVAVAVALVLLATLLKRSRKDLSRKAPPAA